MVKLWFLIKTALKNCYYHRSLGLVIIFTGAVLISVNLLFLVLRMNLDIFFEQLQEKARIEIFLLKGASSDQVTGLYETIKNETRISVRSVVYHDPEQNLKEFFAKNPDIQKIAGMVEDNPLPGTITVHVVVDRKTKEGMQPFIEALRTNEIVTDVIYPQTWFSRLFNLLEMADYVLLGIIAAVFLISYIVWLALFRVALYRVKTEIEIMEIVGGTKLYIRTPFMIESLLFASIAFGLGYGIIRYLVSVTNEAVPGVLFISLEQAGTAALLLMLITLFATEKAISGFFKR